MSGQERWTAEQFQRYLKTGKDPRGKKVKNNNISQAELNYEMIYIRPRFNSGEIVRYETQVEFELWPATEEKKAIVFTPDFRIEYASGQIVIVEMKGTVIKKLQRDFPLRWRRLQELHPEYTYVIEKSEDWSK